MFAPSNILATSHLLQILWYN